MTRSSTFTFVDLSNDGAPVTKALYGNMIDVRLSGLMPGTNVEIRARNRGSGGVGYEAYGVFTAGDDGTVDVASAAPSRGTYTGTDPDGLVWSGEPKPLPDDDHVWTGPNAFALFFTAVVDGVVVANATLPRYLVVPSVTATSVTDNGLVGTFRMPELSRPRGAVIAFGGSEGGLSSGMVYASYFAALGYPSLGLAYFGAPGLPPSLAGVPLEYFQKARDWLAVQPGIDPNEIVVVGASRGGELALLPTGRTSRRTPGERAPSRAEPKWGRPRSVERSR